MSHMDKRAREALDRHITGNYGEDQMHNESDTNEDADDMDLRQAVYSVVNRVIPEIKDDETPIALYVVTTSRDKMIVHSAFHEEANDEESRLEIITTIIAATVQQQIKRALVSPNKSV